MMKVYKRNKLFLALASAGFCVSFGALAAEPLSPADAQSGSTAQADAASDNAVDKAAERKDKKKEEAALLDKMEVRGFRASVETAIAEKRDHTSIVEVISAEDIGKLPDVSIGEALARLPGLTAQRVDGRAQVISVRGLGPDFSTALLNGREQVTTGDNRGIEFDQYPAELLGGVVVYKTPDSTLVGQGLAGTVDLRTIRPLAHGRQSMAINGRYEANNDNALNPDAPDTGYRVTGMFVDQFLDDTLGITLGIASQSTPIQTTRFQQWGDGNFPRLDDSDPESPFIVGGAKPFAASNDLNRFGVIGTIEYKPSENFHSTLDLSYTDFNETQLVRGIEFPLKWSSAQLQPGFTVTDGLVTNGVFDNVRGVMRNDRNERNAQLFTFGWNNRFEFGEGWGFENDISYSRSERSDNNVETYLLLANGQSDSLAFDATRSGQLIFTPSVDYGNPALFGLQDPGGWGGGDGVNQSGFINDANIEDQLAHVKFLVDRSFVDGAISKVTVGADFSRRDKDRELVGSFLVIPGESTNGRIGAEFAPVPSDALLSGQADLSFIGIPGHVSLDPRALLAGGYLVPITAIQTPTLNRGFQDVTNSWKIREDIGLGFVRADLDTNIGSVGVTGNFGLQAIYTDQSSGGFTINQGANGLEVIDVRDGSKYWRVLPSANLIFDFDNDFKARLGAGRTMARARPDQLRASRTTNFNVSRVAVTDPLSSAFSANGGNPNLKPFMSTNVDVSLEQYFADGKGYLALAGFYKDLEDFVDPNQSRVADFSSFIDNYVPAEFRDSLGTPLGLVSGPANTGSGWIAGGEFTASVPLQLLTPALDGFGVISSVTYTDSSVKLSPGEAAIAVPGLSKWVVNSTGYFEKHGFSARLSHRYRDSFLSELFGLSASRLTIAAKSESILDAQVSYELQSGSLKGLTFLAQANNLTNEAFTTFALNNPQLIRDRQKFGVTFLFGASYRF